MEACGEQNSYFPKIFTSLWIYGLIIWQRAGDQGSKWNWSCRTSDLKTKRHSELFGDIPMQTQDPWIMKRKAEDSEAEMALWEKLEGSMMASKTLRVGCWAGKEPQGTGWTQPFESRRDAKSETLWSFRKSQPCQHLKLVRGIWALKLLAGVMRSRH